MRFAAVGHVAAQRPARQRLDEAGQDADVRPPQFVEDCSEDSDGPRPSAGADRTVPCAQASVSPSPLSLAFRRDHDVGRPCGVGLTAADCQADRHRGALTYHGGPFAGQPNQRAIGRVVRLRAVSPVPAEPARVGGVMAEHPSAQRVDRPAVVRPEPIDLRH